MKLHNFDEFTAFADDHADSGFFSDEMRVAVNQLINSDILGEKVREEFFKSVKKGSFTYFSPVNIVMYRSDKVSIAMSYLDPKSMADRYIMPNVSGSYLTVFGGSGLKVNYYEKQKTGKGLALKEQKCIQRGQFCELKTGQHTALPEIQEKDVMMLTIVNVSGDTLTDPVITQYDINTLQPVHANSGDFMHTRLQYCAEILGALKGEQAVAPTKFLCNYKAHYVRWSALESLLNIDFKEGMKTLRQFINDPHPHVRKAAQEALQLLAPMEA